VPAISIIMPFFNRHSLISESVGSVVSQDFSDLEIVIVDDGSARPLQRSDLGNAADDRRIKLVRQDNRGSGAARNAALRLAEGAYFLFLDSDDRLAPGALGALWARRLESDFDAVVGNWRDFQAERTGPVIRPSFAYRDGLANAIASGWATGSAILRRSLQPRCSEEKARLPWDMAECYLRALADPATRIGYVDRDIVMMRQDSADRLTVLYDHFDPVKAGAFWQEMKSAFPLDDERRSAFDQQIFRYVLTLFHAGRPAEAASLFSAIDAHRLTGYPWCRPLSPAWFSGLLGLKMGLGIQRLLHQLRGKWEAAA
jgi:glycosyltransferase involved in cell wall biosynthesis